MVKRTNTTYRTTAYTIKDFYRSYKESVIKGGFPKIDYYTFRAILEEYFEYVQTAILEEGRVIQLPGRFGEISVRKYKGAMSKISYDYHESKLAGVPVWHFNDHTGGSRYKFHWHKRRVMTKNYMKYQLVFTRYNKRRLAEILKNNERDYIDL